MGSSPGFKGFLEGSGEFEKSSASERASERLRFLPPLRDNRTIDLEVSVGKLGPGDLKDVSSKILALTPKTL